jgi:hypothetical protein
MYKIAPIKALCIVRSKMESSVKQLFSFFEIDTGAEMSNSTVRNPSESQSSSLISLLLTFPALRDWLKLIVIGGILETCRRSFFSIWNSIVASFFITAQFQDDDDSYDWMMVWLSKQPAWSTFLLMPQLNRTKLNKCTQENPAK